MKTVLGLSFFEGPASAAVASARGVCVFPSGPGLATLDKDARYRDALLKADVRYVDSGFLVLCWFVFTGRGLSRVSGLAFLREFLAQERSRTQTILWVHPSAQAQEENTRFLVKHGFPGELQAHYVAPMYSAEGKIEDAALLTLIQEKQPAVIVINLGSGIQEPLAAWLKKNLSYTPTILCTGGAIDFLTGAQVKISRWADTLFLGWLFRILGTPFKKSQKLRTSPLHRYILAWRLLWLVARYRDKLPIA